MGRIKSIGHAALIAAALSWPAAADEIALSSGGSLRGEVAKDADLPPGAVQVRTSSGIELRLSSKLVKKATPIAPERADYEQRALHTADTVEAQFELAEWCKQQKLLRDRDVHLRRVIELDADHAKARHALGYQKTASGWHTREEQQTKLGYVRYEGRLRTPQEIEILKRQDKDDKAELDWIGKLDRWRKWLGGKRANEALAGFAQVSDPYAVPGLVKLLDREVNPSYRLIYLRSLSQIDSGSAHQALLRLAVMDREAEIRESSLDELVRRKSPDTVAQFAKSLRSKDNLVVNRAAYALGRMGDSAAVGPLIDALITTHKFQIQKQAPGSTAASFGRNVGGGSGWGPGGMTMGNSPKTVNQPMRNQSALDALVSLTGGVNFDYDARAWQYWFSQQQQQQIQARRDSAPPE